MPTLAGLNSSAVGVLSVPSFLCWLSLLSPLILLFLFQPITHYSPAPPHPKLSILALHPSRPCSLSLCSLPVVLLRGICCCMERGGGCQLGFQHCHNRGTHARTRTQAHTGKGSKWPLINTLSHTHTHKCTITNTSEKHESHSHLYKTNTYCEKSLSGV